MSTTTQLLNNNFGGIRRKDAYFSADKITCSDCQNVELFYTKLNSGVGIRTAKGNLAVTTYTNTIELIVYKYIEDDDSADEVEVVDPTATDEEVDEDEDNKEKGMTTIASDGSVVDETLTFSVDDVSYSYTRNSDGDCIIDDVYYYAWINDESIVYTVSDENEKETLSVIPDDEQIIEIFETVQDTITYLICYTENETEGKLYHIDIDSKTANLLIDGLTVTGKACGCDFAQGWLDMFVFSNGEEIKYIYTDTEAHEPLQIEEDDNLTLQDQDGRTVKGLGLVNFDSRLWVFDGKVLWYSEQAECRNFYYNDTDVTTSAGYIEFVKNITAIYPYLGTLAVFHKDSSVLVSADEDTLFSQSDESPGGCASYRSLVFHGTDLYFYDNTKKGVFSFQQVVNGDKTLGDNIALDIQEELMEISSNDVDKIKALSVVTSDRNEVWFLTPISDDENYSIVMIYDYLRGEWVKRKCQSINTVSIIDNTLYSAGKEIYEEYTGTTFNGEFIENSYTCSMFNLGADNTMKITKFPPRLTDDGNTVSNF